MASDVVYGAIQDHLTATWHATPIAWENTQFTRPTEAAWIQVEVSGTSYAQQSIGASQQADNRWDEEGQLWLHVFVPADSGSLDARRYGRQLADLFRGTLLLNDTLEFMDASIGLGEPGSDDGLWFRISVSVDWRHMGA